ADTIALYLASPSATPRSAWWSSTGLSRIIATLRYMTLHYPIDPEKIFLAGVSDGATGCFAAANTINGPFAGFIAISGFGGMLPQLGMNLVPGNLRRRPFYCINAGNDQLYPIAVVRQFYQWLKDNGVTLIDTVYANQGHGFDYRRDERQKICRLIAAWRRPQTTTIEWTVIPQVPNIADNILWWHIDDGTTAPFNQIKASWSRDTLYVQQQGIKQCAIIAASPLKNGQSFSMSVNGQRVTALQPQKMSVLTLLELFVHNCYPYSQEQCIFPLHF
ncbi:MAG: hypothetical protein JW795_09520, partial [Chitinivibrionales bacterium]|nr:hypothetical protein [Chitinivibrionales bacterium]